MGRKGKPHVPASPCRDVFRPEFAAVCDACGATTMWFKANRMRQAEDGPVVEKGYKCADCETFEEKVLDSRGRIHDRE